MAGITVFGQRSLWHVQIGGEAAKRREQRPGLFIRGSHTSTHGCGNTHSKERIEGPPRMVHFLLPPMHTGTDINSLMSLHSSLTIQLTVFAVFVLSKAADSKGQVTGRRQWASLTLDMMLFCSGSFITHQECFRVFCPPDFVNLLRFQIQILLVYVLLP